MGQYSFLKREVHENRVTFNRLESAVDCESKYKYFTVRDVQRLMCNVGISVSVNTIQHWLRIRFLNGFKLGKKRWRRWRISHKGLIEFIGKMRKINEDSIRDDYDPLDLRYGVQPKVRQKRRVRVYRELPQRDSRGRFRKKQRYNHREMYGRVN